MKRIFYLFILLNILPSVLNAQNVKQEKIKKRITEYQFLSPQNKSDLSSLRFITVILFDSCCNKPASKTMFDVKTTKTVETNYFYDEKGKCIEIQRKENGDVVDVSKSDQTNNYAELRDLDIDRQKYAKSAGYVHSNNKEGDVIEMISYLNEGKSKRINIYIKRVIEYHH